VKKRITVIGAGIVGVATACYLRREGHEVTIVTEHPPGEYCSFGNAGILSPASCVPQAMPGILAKVPRYLLDPLGPLAVRWSYLPRAAPWLVRFVASATRARVERAADALHALLARTFDAYLPLVERAGCADLVRRSGYLVVYESRRAAREDALVWKLRRDRGVVVEELDSAGLRRMVPALAPRYTLGFYLPEQGYVADPEGLTKALAAQFERDGGVILRRKVLDVAAGPAGVRSLATDEGEVPVQTLVVCAGVHSGEIAARLGELVPLEAERGYHVVFPDSGVELPLPVSSAEHKFFVTPMRMGLRAAGQAEFAGIYAEPNYERAEVLARLARRMFPAIRPDGATRWMGRRPSFPDSLPVIGPSRKHRNVFYAFGHGHNGLSAAAATGAIIADLVAGRTPPLDLAPFRVDRF
jgi:D-amino-acid dehydrogenase